MSRQWLLVLLLIALLATTFAEDFEVEEEAEEELTEDAGEDEAEENKEVEELDALSPDQLRQLHGKLDGNQDGMVTLAETLEFAEKLRKEVAGKDLHLVVEEMDTDKDGKLSFEEVRKDFIKFDEDMDEKEKERQLALEKAKFKMADEDHDGKLDVKELPSLFFPDSHHGVLELMAKALIEQKDKDNDQLLTPREFWEIPDQEMEIPAAEMKDFQKLDKDHNGKLDTQELKLWESGQFHTEMAMHKLFEIADKDHDSHLTAAELAEASEAIKGTEAHFTLWGWLLDTVDSEL